MQIVNSQPESPGDSVAVRPSAWTRCIKRRGCGVAARSETDFHESSDSAVLALVIRCTGAETGAGQGLSP
jgi:hypothetical protein